MSNLPHLAAYHHLKARLRWSKAEVADRWLAVFSSRTQAWHSVIPGRIAETKTGQLKEKALKEKVLKEKVLKEKLREDTHRLVNARKRQRAHRSGADSATFSAPFSDR